MSKTQKLMPPHAQWQDWFAYVWNNAFPSTPEGKKNYYYFSYFLLSYICYPMGRDAARRRVAEADETKAVAAGTIDSTIGANSFNLVIMDLSGMYALKFIITRSIIAI
jgi:hypothetical protein